VACRDTNKPLTDVEFLGQAWSVCFVGYDKMVGALCGVVSLVATHTHVEQRLRHEIGSNEAGDLPSVDTMHMWPYAQVCAVRSLRCEQI
jgi:cytochrome P450